MSRLHIGQTCKAAARRTSSPCGNIVEQWIEKSRVQSCLNSDLAYEVTYLKSFVIWFWNGCVVDGLSFSSKTMRFVSLSCFFFFCQPGLISRLLSIPCLGRYAKEMELLSSDEIVHQQDLISILSDLTSAATLPRWFPSCNHLRLCS